MNACGEEAAIDNPQIDYRLDAKTDRKNPALRFDR